jgi:hypothetical protein
MLQVQTDEPHHARFIIDDQNAAFRIRIQAITLERR